MLENFNFFVKDYLFDLPAFAFRGMLLIYVAAQGKCELSNSQMLKYSTDAIMSNIFWKIKCLLDYYGHASLI